MLQPFYFRKSEERVTKYVELTCIRARSTLEALHNVLYKCFTHLLTDTSLSPLSRSVTSLLFHFRLITRFSKNLFHRRLLVLDPPPVCCLLSQSLEVFWILVFVSFLWYLFNLHFSIVHYYKLEAASYWNHIKYLHIFIIKLTTTGIVCLVCTAWMWDAVVWDWDVWLLVRDETETFPDFLKREMRLRRFKTAGRLRHSRPRLRFGHTV